MPRREGLDSRSRDVFQWGRRGWKKLFEPSHLMDHRSTMNMMNVYIVCPARTYGHYAITSAWWPAERLSDVRRGGGWRRVGTGDGDLEVGGRERVSWGKG